MKNLKKKGFTIVELVIVIAVIAVLAAVLIPTFVNLTRKANISADTVLAKNLNTALAVYDAENDIEDFNDVIEAIKEHGYLIANLNAKAEGCYFVWESETNQILLVDSTENCKVLYSVKDINETPDNSWYFAISNKEKSNAIKTAYQDVNVKQTVANKEDLKTALSESGEIFLDESVVLDISNRLEFNVDNTTVTVNLGNSQLTTDTSLTNQFPIDIKKGTVVINGGIVGASGTNLDLDGKLYKTPIDSSANTNVTINNTVFNGDNSPIQFAGAAALNNVKVNGGYFYAYANGQVTLNNCESHNIDDVAIWVTNTLKKDGNYDYQSGTATLTINGGKYSSEVNSGDYGAVSVLNGTIVINDGEFQSAEGYMFSLVGKVCPKIIINGGTFNGIKFNDLTVEILQKMTVKGTVSKTSEGFVIQL